MLHHYITFYTKCKQASTKLATSCVVTIHNIVQANLAVVLNRRKGQNTYWTGFYRHHPYNHHDKDSWYAELVDYL